MKGQFNIKKINHCNLPQQQSEKERPRGHPSKRRESIWQKSNISIPDKNSKQTRNRREPPQLTKGKYLFKTLQYPKERKVRTQVDTYTPMSIAALFTVANKWKQPMCPAGA